ncbi:phosphatase PAP2 family protein [Flavobacterium taihuense]|uniref:Phosphatase PAP2 family protein n=1 Tax=Flavobacterium taihuense TaxID=2857508 RepID=A0ABS6XZN6_9FLAO|nr:phosphatase PAP2 family protein [Flavobacterium taihuense]MBW4362138.1 phosphatase PAP2 family protein [Flavobacterium taihuense]
MNFRKIVLLLLMPIWSSLFAQTMVKANFQDSIPDSSAAKPLKFNPKQLILPTALIGFGFIGINSDQIKDFNSEVSEEVVEHIDKQITIDDFTQYAPAAAVYALGALGVKGKNNLKDKSIILASSFLIMNITVLSLKSITKVERPDGTSNNSFPSGHTATAFMGAEFLYQEYKDVSLWYGVSGYVVAAATGAFRVYNDRHWVTDVAAGAGIGILSAKAGYWLFPTVNKLFASKSNPNRKSAFIPYYDGKQVGFGYVSSF